MCLHVPLFLHVRGTERSSELARAFVVFFGDPIRLLGARAIAFDALIVATPIHRRPVQLCFPA